MKAGEKKVPISKEYSNSLKQTLEGLVSYLIDKKPEDPVSAYYVVNAIICRSLICCSTLKTFKVLVSRHSVRRSVLN